MAIGSKWMTGGFNGLSWKESLRPKRNPVVARYVLDFAALEEMRELFSPPDATASEVV